MLYFTVVYINVIYMSCIHITEGLRLMFGLLHRMKHNEVLSLSVIFNVKCYFIITAVFSSFKTN